MKKKILGSAAALAIFSLVLPALLLGGIPVLAADEPNLLVNPGFEEAGVPIDQGGWGDPTYAWHPFSLGYTRDQAFHNGGYSINISGSDTVSLAGAYQRVSLNQTEIKPVFIGGFVKGV